MAARTHLSVIGIPGPIRTVSAKTEAEPEPEEEGEPYLLLPKRFPEMGLGEIRIDRSKTLVKHHGFGGGDAAK